MELRRTNIILMIYFLSNIVYSQKYIFQNRCYIGDSINSERIDTLNYQSDSDLEFIQKNLIDFQPSYFNYVILKKKTKKPVVRKISDGFIIEYYDLKSRLVKYTFYETTGQSFDVEIKYLDSGKPYKLIEYFADEHHSENGIFSIQYDIIYNDNNELIQIESINGDGYLCKVSRL